MEKIVFYINDIFVLRADDKPDFSLIPINVRRRLSDLDKRVLFALDRIYDNEVVKIVYSSTFGELDKLNSIIEQYNEYDEVSPAKFSGAVHNYPVAYFNLYKQINIPYYALSSCENSISSALIESVLSLNGDVLFCYADKDCIVGKISKEKKSFDAIKCQLVNLSKDTNNEFAEFLDFIEGKKDAFASIVRIKK